MKQLFLVHFANVCSIRAQFGTEMPFNAVHGSQDREDASRELALLFPTFKFSDEVLEASLCKSSRQFVFIKSAPNIWGGDNNYVVTESSI